MGMELTKRIASVKKDFNLNSTRSCVFHHSQWESCNDGEHASIPYLIYRILFMMILVTSITFSRVCKSYLFDVFLTNWSLNLQNLYAILFCINIIWRNRAFLAQKLRLKFRPSKQESDARNSSELKMTYYDNMIDVTTNEDRNDLDTATGVVTASSERLSSPLNTITGSMKKSDPSVNVIVTNKNVNHKGDSPTVIEKVIWILINVTHVLPHIVAVGYWIFVYNPDPGMTLCETVRSHYIVHGATSALAMIDSLVVAVPVRMTHFVFPSFVLLVYSIFSYLYEVFGGQYENDEEFIYSFLNWRHKPGMTLMLVVGGMILSPLVHTITCWGVHHIRLKLVPLSKRYFR